MSEFTIRFFGSEKMRPNLVSSKDLAKVIAAVEDMIAAVVMAERTTVKRKNIVVGLTAINDQSLGLTYAPKNPDYIFGIEQVIRALVEQSYFSLPLDAYAPVKEILNFVKRHNCEATISTAQNKQLIAHIDSKTKEPETVFLQGTTIVYGKLVRIGGKIPRAVLDTTEQGTLYCEVKSEKLAQILADRLYQTIGVEGTATWFAHSARLKNFTIERLLEYKNISILEAFEALQKAAGNSFDHIIDVDTFAQNLRDGAL